MHCIISSLVGFTDCFYRKCHIIPFEKHLHVYMYVQSVCVCVCGSENVVEQAYIWSPLKL